MTNANTDRDPGAFIGGEPELAAERIPGGVRPQDERVAATQSEPAVRGEPESDGDDVAEGSIGSDVVNEEDAAAPRDGR